LELGLDLYIANMEEPYDAHGDVNSLKFHLPDDYLIAFRSSAPDIELGVTTTPRWASNHEALRKAGAVYMPQAFCADYPEATVANCVSFAESWGWEARYIRPLCQVYESPAGTVPSAGQYLAESEAANVGLVPYILEQALGGQGRALLDALEPAISRPPAPGNGSPSMELIGSQHGITAAVERLRKLDPGGTRPDRKPDDLSTWGAYDKLERTLSILARDHDATIHGSGAIKTTAGPATASSV